MDSDQVLVAIRAFAASLYSQVLNESTHTADNLRNQFMSPVSLYAALSLALAGSAGNTRDELLKAMHLPSSEHDEALHKAIGHTLTAMLKSNNSSTVSLGNGLFVQQSAPIHESYKSMLAQLYGALAENVDFRGNPEAARKHINQFVNDRVGGKISELLPIGSVHRDLVAVLVNTLYFIGKWAEPFELPLTNWGDFFPLNGKSSGVHMMYQAKVHEWLDLPDLDAQLIKLDFDCCQCGWKMVIVLPNKLDGLPGLLKQLENADRCASLLKAAGTRKLIRLWLPRFKLGSDDDWDTMKTLQNMGLTSMFDLRKANFSGIINDELAISGVKHKAVLEVDEHGAVATAATALMVANSCELGMEGVTQFRVDHPFCVFLIDEHGTPMFMGHVVKMR